MLVGLGQANERIARTQDSFASNSSATWLASVERSLAQMKEYQVCHRVEKTDHRLTKLIECQEEA